MSVENRWLNFFPFPPLWPSDQSRGDIFGRFTALISPYDDQVNFFRNYKTVELVLNNRCWLYSAYSRPHLT